MKPQHVRLLDVFVLGPAMVLGGYYLQTNRPLLGGLLLVTGIGTIVYNGGNYVAIEHERGKP